MAAPPQKCLDRGECIFPEKVVAELIRASYYEGQSAGTDEPSPYPTGRPGDVSDVGPLCLLACKEYVQLAESVHAAVADGRLPGWQNALTRAFCCLLYIPNVYLVLGGDPDGGSLPKASPLRKHRTVSASQCNI